jgi:hypothetical protein
MDPNAALKVIEDRKANMEDRRDAVGNLSQWLDRGGFSPSKAPFLKTGRDVVALARGLGIPHVGPR